MADSDALTNKFHGALKKLQLFILDFDAVALDCHWNICPSKEKVILLSPSYEGYWSCSSMDRIEVS